MTEAEWLTSNDPAGMLRWADGYVNVQSDYRRNAARLNPSTARERLLRLFACGVGRQVWHLLSDERSRRAVEVAEQYADGLATEEELAAAYQESTCFRQGVEYVECANCRAHRAASPTERLSSATGGEKCLVPAAQAHLLRDIIGNPFRPVTLSKCGRCDGSGNVLATRGSVVLGLAQTAYADRDFALLPLLADALEDAGCADGDILDHLRGPGPHARGCWVVDLILGKS